MRSVVISLPEFISPEALDNLYQKAMNNKKNIQKIFVDFSALNSINQQSFEHFLGLEKSAGLLGLEVVACAIPAHIAIVMCTWEIEELQVCRECYDK